MSDVATPIAHEPETGLLSADASATAGSMLRRSREAAGLHIGALAVSLKVPVRKLEALESDQIDLLPDAVFARALAASVCRTLKIDPGPVLDKLPQTSAPRLHPGEAGINAPFHTPGEARTLAGRHLSKPVVALVLVLLLGALVLVLMPSPERSPRVVERALPADQNLMPQTSGPVAVPAAAMASSTDVMPLAVTPTPVPSPTAVSSAPVSQPPMTSASTTPTGATEPGAGILLFKARTSSWVQVVDAKGMVQLSKTLSPGEAVGVSGALPLSVVVGRMDATEVQVRGKPLDLLPLGRDNVARFEVK